MALMVLLGKFISHHLRKTVTNIFKISDPGLPGENAFISLDLVKPEKGDKGVQGRMGNDGPKGDKGYRGADGLPGLKGEVG